MRNLMRLGSAALVLTALGSGAAAAAETAALYDTYCALCHQAAGAGASSQFPRLAGRVGAIAADPKGRAYLVQVVHNGLSGTIVVDGAPLTGVMPAQAQLTPDDVARILNYLLELRPERSGGSPEKRQRRDAGPPAPHAHPKPFTAKEVTSLAAGSKSRDELLAERKALVDARVIP